MPKRGAEILDGRRKAPTKKGLGRESGAGGEEARGSLLVATHDLERFGPLAVANELSEELNDGSRMGASLQGGHLSDGRLDVRLSIDWADPVQRGVEIVEGRPQVGWELRTLKIIQVFKIRGRQPLFDGALGDESGDCRLKTLGQIRHAEAFFVVLLALGLLPPA